MTHMISAQTTHDYFYLICHISATELPPKDKTKVMVVAKRN